VINFFVKRVKFFFVLVWLILAGQVSFAASPAIRLQCEHLPDPIGIDNPHPRLSWQVQSQLQTSYSITVSTDSLGLVKDDKQSDQWKSTARSTQQMVTYTGKALQPFTKYYWKVTANGKPSGIASFETGMMAPSDWKGDWLISQRDREFKPAPYFRKSFELQKKIVSARAYIAAAGLYELYLNGNKVGDHVLDPMYTRFDRRNLYVTYDVTKQLQQGKNAIGVILGNGWYNFQSIAAWFFDKAPWRGEPCFCMDLRITYSDGTVQTISTDHTWKTTASNITFNSIYAGEHVDDMQTLSGWKEAGFEDTTWDNARIIGAPSKHIVAQALYPIRDIAKLTPVSCKKFNDTDYVFDLGRNFAGVSELRINGGPGTIVKLKHGEKLYPNGHVDLSNIDFFYPASNGDFPFATDIYKLNGKRTESFRPLFNYKGFQYVEVTSSKPVKLDKGNLNGIVMHSDVPQAGQLSSSNSIINQLWNAANNSYTSNLFGYPTDCPQREKNGWTADAALAVETGLYNYDSITIYEKWLADMRDEQQANGMLPGIVPSSGWGYQGYNTVDWISALVIVPWEMYQFYGDSKALSDNYEAMCRYVNHLDETYPNGLISEGLGDREELHQEADIELTSSAYYYQDAMILMKTAKLFGRIADEQKYTVLALKIKTAFNHKFYHADSHNYGSGLQTENSMALYYGLVPASNKALVAANLVKSVTTGGLHLDVGVLGNKAILNALSENGYVDVAYRLVCNVGYPSWGYWMKHGMTTLAESWDMQTSLNHIFMGEFSAWFYKGLGGINIDEHDPGFHHILLKPYIPAGLDRFETSHDGPYGNITSGWKTENGKVIYTAIIPPNSSADLALNLRGKVVTTTHLLPGTYHFQFKSDGE